MARRRKVGNKQNPRRQPQETVTRELKWRNYEQFFLIVCEGSEADYFEGIVANHTANKIYVESIDAGRAFDQIVADAKKHREEIAKKVQYENGYTNFDALDEDTIRDIVKYAWVVMDADEADANAFPEHTFGDDEPEKQAKQIQNRKQARTSFLKACSMADDSNISIAHTNQAIELWYLLHFTAVSPSTPLHRKTLDTMLEAQLTKKQPGFEYTHGKAKVIDGVLQWGNRQEAINRAQELSEQHRLEISSPETWLQANPSTRVHVLVKELQEVLSYYQNA